MCAFAAFQRHLLVLLPHFTEKLCLSRSLFLSSAVFGQTKDFFFGLVSALFCFRFCFKNDFLIPPRLSAQNKTNRYFLSLWSVIVVLLLPCQSAAVLLLLRSYFSSQVSLETISQQINSIINRFYLFKNAKLFFLLTLHK